MNITSDGITNYCSEVVDKIRHGNKLFIYYAIYDDNRLHRNRSYNGKRIKYKMQIIIMGKREIWLSGNKETLKNAYEIIKNKIDLRKLKGLKREGLTWE